MSHNMHSDSDHVHRGDVIISHANVMPEKKPDMKGDHLKLDSINVEAMCEKWTEKRHWKGHCWVAIERECVWRNISNSAHIFAVENFASKTGSLSVYKY